MFIGVKVILNLQGRVGKLHVVEAKTILHSFLVQISTLEDHKASRNQAIKKHCQEA